MGKLSALCGCVVASTGSSCGITYLMGGDFTRICNSVKNINIPHDCQMGGLVLEIFIQNCDGTRYKKRHAYPKPWWNHKANGKSDMRKLKIHKTISKRNLNNQEGNDSEGCLPELKFHKFLK